MKKYTVSLKIDGFGWYEVFAAERRELAHELYYNLLALLLDGKKHGYSAVMWAVGNETIEAKEI